MERLPHELSSEIANIHPSSLRTMTFLSPTIHSHMLSNLEKLCQLPINLKELEIFIDNTESGDTFGLLYKNGYVKTTIFSNRGWNVAMIENNISIIMWDQIRSPMPGYADATSYEWFIPDITTMYEILVRRLGCGTRYGSAAEYAKKAVKDTLNYMIKTYDRNMITIYLDLCIRTRHHTVIDQENAPPSLDIGSMYGQLLQYIELSLTPGVPNITGTELIIQPYNVKELINQTGLNAVKVRYRQLKIPGADRRADVILSDQLER